jgi:hypothetical protein
MHQDSVLQTNSYIRIDPFNTVYFAKEPIKYRLLIYDDKLDEIPDRIMTSDKSGR